MLKFCVEAWTINGDEEPYEEEEMEQEAEFTDINAAKQWCWDRMEEGFQTRLWRR